MHKTRKINVPTPLEDLAISLAGEFPTTFIAVAVAVNFAWVAGLFWMAR
jgi:hypothetical protein